MLGAVQDLQRVGSQSKILQAKAWIIGERRNKKAKKAQETNDLPEEEVEDYSEESS